MKRSISIIIAVLIMVCAPLCVFADAGEDIPAEEQHLPAELVPQDSDGPSTDANLAVSDYSYVRCLLSTAKDSVKITVSGKYSVDDEDGNVKAVLSNEGIYYLVAGSGSTIVINDSDGKTLYSGSYFKLTEHTPPSGLEYNSIKMYNTWYERSISYKGDFIVKNKLLNNKTGVQIVNRVFMEDYVKGVIGYEMGNGQPAQALRAQAVCSRGYACYLVRSYYLRDYDMLDTSANQVYRGIPPTSHQDCIEAVDDTAGMIMTYNGNIVQSIFAATNGGEIDTCANKWSGNGYLVSLDVDVVKDDPYDLAYIKASPSSNYETVTLYKNPSNKTNDATNMLITRALLPLLEDGAEPVVTNISITGNHANRHDECFHYESFKVKFTYSLGTEKNLTQTATIKDTDLYVKPSNGLPYGWFNYSRLSCYTLAEASSTYTVSHVRWGHGVGMSQYGARYMAKQGRGWKEILSFYYGGINSNKVSFTKYTFTRKKLNDILDAPTLTGINTTPTTARVSWTNSPGAAGYVLYRRASDVSKWTLVAQTSNVRAYTDDDMVPGKTYYYFARAVSDDGVYSDISRVLVLRGRPAQVSSLKATWSSSSRKVTLKWSGVTGADGYRISRYESGSGTGWKYFNISADSASYTDSSAKAGKKYYYYVQAYTKTDSGNVFGYNSVRADVTCK